MRRMAAMQAKMAAVIAALIVVSGSAGAQGGGSLGLDDVLGAVKTDPKLVAEIQDELKMSGLKADGVVCTGFRHNNRWTALSGARAAPYKCDIGKRQIVIQADRMYFDAARRALGDVKKANPKRADSLEESNFRWTWKPVSNR